MVKIHSILVSDIAVAPNRQRREFDHGSIAELAGSIAQNGLISPVVVRKGTTGDYQLVAGERRLRALSYLWNFGETLHCGGQKFSENEVPCIYLGDLNEVDAFEVELEENIRRQDLTWQERAQATAKLAKLRVMQAREAGKPLPEMSDIALEVRPDDSHSHALNVTRKEVIVSKYLNDPDIAKAKTLEEGWKALKRKENGERSIRLGLEVGRNFSITDHTLHQGDCLTIIQELLNGPLRYDVILSDPPYGINAQEFGDSGGVGGSTGGHFYADSPTEWRRLMERFCALAFEIARPQAHAYLFCDVEMFSQLKVYMTMGGWKCFRTPLIWVNPGGMRAPWPTQGPQRKYQMILYAVKGDRLVKKLAPDVLTYTQDSNLGHPAQKPVALYQDLLRRSCDPGDYTLDPFCGSGTIFAAAHDLKIRATGIEQDPASYGIAAKRLGELK